MYYSKPGRPCNVTRVQKTRIGVIRVFPEHRFCEYAVPTYRWMAVAVVFIAVVRAIKRA